MKGFARFRAVTARNSLGNRRLHTAGINFPTALRPRRRSAPWLAVLAAAVWTVGCQSPAAPFDPFLAGRNTIPPPGTAAPAAAAPYYNAAPPTVTVPAPGATYTAPGAIPAAPPAISVPPAGAGQLPRGISVPQSNKQSPDNDVQIARWQISESSTAASTRAKSLAGAKSSGTKNKQSHVELATSASGVGSRRQSDGVVRASYEEQDREAPIRIVEPAATPKAAATASGSAAGRTANEPSAAAPARGAPRFRKLPELTDYPPAESSKSSKQ